jgi:hypothetical protein
MKMKSQLLKAPENEISGALKETIKEWDEEVTSLQILKTLDFGVHSGRNEPWHVTDLIQKYYEQF